MRRVILIILLSRLLIPELAGQDWIVPDDKKGRLSTFAFDDKTRDAGAKLFAINCASCHGTPGKGNFLNLVPPPGDPASEKIQKNSDGELFYKLSTGRGQMPSFRSVLTTEEIWNVISYIRSSNKAYKQVVMSVISSSAYPGSTIKMSLALNSEENVIVLTASAHKDNKSVPVTDAGVKLFVQRTFGHLLLDEEKSTDKNGKAIFSIPEKMPGDSLGNVLISARFSDEILFGTDSKDTLLAAGIKTIPVSLVKDRAMWNTVRKAPLWILLTYTLGVLISWGFILLVLLKIRDIYITGKYILSGSEEKNNSKAL